MVLDMSFLQGFLPWRTLNFIRDFFFFFLHLSRWWCDTYPGFCLCFLICVWCQLSITGIKPSWSWCTIFLMCWILFGNNLLKIFTSIFIKEFDLSFSSIVLLSSYDLRLVLALYYEFGSIYFFSILWNSLKNIDVSS